MAVGWLQQGATGLNPVWPYFRWDAATQKQVTSDQQPLPHDRVLRHVETLIRTASNPLVLLRFRAAKELEDPDGEVVPFMVSISLRGTQADECHDALQALSHNSVLKLLGLRLRPERLRKGPMAEAVEEAYLATPALQALSHNSVLKLLGLRLRPERLRKGPMAEAVEEAYLATPWTDWKPRRGGR
eukprot:s6359_g4.t1